MTLELLGQHDGLRWPWLWVLPVLLGAVSVWGLLPRAARRPRWWAAAVGLAALAAAGMTLLRPAESLVHGVLFHLFSGLAITAAVCMIANRNPLYAALWFAVVTLCVCGLFLVCAAPFLAAAMTIVYAGAIIVTFLFLIMLAQQAVGAAAYDQHARQPLAATLAGFIVLGGVLCGLQQWFPHSSDASAPDAHPPGASASAPHPPNASARGPHRPLAMLPREQSPPVDSLSRQRPEESMGAVRGLGRTLFGSYLYAVELAGTLLLVAAIGAIAIGLRGPRGGRR